MDPPLPENFDPYRLIDNSYPMQNPGEGDNEANGNEDPKQDESERESKMLPLHAFLPEPLRRFVVAGSCCGTVVALSLITSWDHGWLPGVESPFASRSIQSDVADMYLLSLALTIRELSDQNCRFYSPALTAQIETLQLKYLARTKVRYLHDCKKSDAQQ